jgi:hypothetical protein
MTSLCRADPRRTSDLTSGHTASLARNRRAASMRAASFGT